MPGNGKTANDKEKASGRLPMAPTTKDIGKMAVKTAMALVFFLMVQNIRGSGNGGDNTARDLL